MEKSEFDRRIFRREFEALLGCGATWFKTLSDRGDIPPGRVDPGGRRLWWLASEVRATLEKLTEKSERRAA